MGLACSRTSLKANGYIESCRNSLRSLCSLWLFNCRFKVESICSVRALRPGVFSLGLCAFLAGAAALPAGTNLSTWVYPGKSGRLLHQADAFGNRVLDYSAVGYRGGTVPIPDVPVKATLSPAAGDDGANIQNAINTVKALPLDSNGFRGAVLLTAGEYDIAGSVTINASGIILRGVGDGVDGTVLRATGTNQRSLVVIGGSGSPSTVAGTTRNITNNYVPVGARSFNVDSTAGLAAGDRVLVRRIATDQWIKDLGMDLLGPASGGDPDDVPWTASGYNMEFDRVITRIEGNRIMIDAPLTCAIEARYAGGTIREYTWAGRIQNCGIEDIRGVSDYTAPEDENHGWVLVEFRTIEQAWARRLTAQYFGYSCVALQGGTKWTTVRDCKSLDPISIITGGRRYAFVMDDCQLCLVQSCYTLKDRHQFVTQSLTTGPNVFVDGLSDTAYSDAGPHHRWGTGALWDNVTVNGDSVNIQNRGNLGTGHGWAGANEVAWNCDADGFVVQNPPGARNWLIGNIGPIRNGTVYVGPHDPGTYDSPGAAVFPNSVYYAQLQDRLAATRVETREYGVGEINQFAADSPTGTVVAVDAAWRSQVQAAFPGAMVNGFDLVTNNQVVPFTFNFTLSASDRIVGATLTVALRALSLNTTNETLFLDHTTNGLAFAALGWQPVATATNTSVRLLDLADHLPLLADGRLNLAVRSETGLDWATLELQVAPVQTFYTNALPAATDAYVRGGAYAGSNYGAAQTLDIKADSSADTQRKAFLTWNFAGFSARVVHARLRLTPVSVGTNGLENAVALAASNDWEPETITWNNAPGAGHRFASWIPAVNQPVEIVVTPQVQAALAGDGRLSLQLASLKNVGAPGLVSYGSIENPVPSRRPQLLLVTTNPVPSISTISDTAIPSDSNTGPLAFIVSDPFYAASLLSVGAMAANTNLVPRAGLTLSGSSSNRAITVTPAAGRVGMTLVSVTVTNPAGMTATTQFTLTVTNAGGSNPPTISALSDRRIAVNSTTGPIPFTVGDPAYDPALLTVGAASANPVLVPASGLALDGSASDRTLTVTPALAQIGSAVITLTATNPSGLTAQSQFTLTVTNGLAGAAPASGDWARDASGDWNNPLNWTSGIVATGADMTATFAVDVTATRYVNNDSIRTLGHLTFGDGNTNTPGTWILTNQPITLAVSSGTPSMTVAEGAGTLATTLAGGGGFSKQGEGLLELSGANTFAGPVVLGAGPLRVKHASSLGEPGSGTTINNAATARLELANNIVLSEPITVACKGSALGNVPAVVNLSGTNILAGPMTLTAGGSYWTFEAAGGKLIVSGSPTNITTTNVRTIWLRGGATGQWESAIGDSAAALSTAVRKDDPGTWTLAGANHYTGNTVVSNGVLLVNGLITGGGVTVAGGTLGGSGIVKAPVAFHPGTMLSPGTSIGTLTVSNNLSLAEGCTTFMELNGQTLTNDQVRGLSNVTYAGTLVLTNVAGTLAGGQSYRLFSAATSSGNFSALLPSSPGANLAWSFNPGNGTLSVTSIAPPNITNWNYSAGGFTLSGEGPAGRAYRVLVATNLAMPPTSWNSIATGFFVNGVFSVTDNQATDFTQRFYRVVTP